jgi:hypothetical protein
MDAFKNWNNSTISLMGNGDSKRSTVSKLVLMGLIGVMTAKALTLPLHDSSQHTDPAQDSTQFSQMVNHMDPVGKKINELYGNDNTVFVYANDANLKEVLAHTDNQFLKKMPDIAQTSVIRSAAEKLLESKLNLHMDQDYLHKSNAYDNVKSGKIGAFAWQDRSANIGGSEYKPGQGVVLLNDAELDLSDHPTHFPRESLPIEFNEFTFIHEVTHGTDNHLSDIEGLSGYDSQVLDESIADAGAALVNLKITGNMDQYELVRKPQRLTSAIDNGHATTEIVDRALSDVTYETVSKLSDREIMLYAQDRVIQTAQNMMEKNQVSDNGRLYSDWDVHQWKNNILVGTKNMDPDTYEKSSRWLNKVTDGNMDKILKDTSRSAMEASINNLAYENKLQPREADFIKSVENHVAKYNDSETQHALDQSMNKGHLDYQKFAGLLGMKVDFGSHERQQDNVNLITNYYNSVIHAKDSSVPATPSASVNLSQQTVDRYNNKTISDFKQPLNRLQKDDSPSFGG